MNTSSLIIATVIAITFIVFLAFWLFKRRSKKRRESAPDTEEFFIIRRETHSSSHHNISIQGDVGGSVIITGDSNRINRIEKERIQKIEAKRKARQRAFKEKYRISIAHPKLLSKRYSSRFLVQIYLPKMRADVLRAVKSAFKENMAEHIQDSELETGQAVKLKLSSPEIAFSEPVIKKLDKSVNTTNFTAKPNDGCYPGIHTIVLSISDADTGFEYQSISFTVQVVDFAFDHVSRPLLSKAFSIATGIGSLVMFVLTLLGQIDMTLGLATGTTAGILASGIYGRFVSLYQQPKAG